MDLKEEESEDDEEEEEGRDSMEEDERRGGEAATHIRSESSAVRANSSTAIDRPLIHVSRKHFLLNYDEKMGI